MSLSLGLISRSGSCKYIDNLAPEKIESRHLSESLKVAIEVGNLCVCERIVKDGANLNSGIPSCFGCPPLLFALFHERTQIAEYLIHQEASLDGSACHLWNTQGYTVFHFAAGGGWANLLELLITQSPEMILEIETAVHPLHLAIANGHVDCFDLIVNHAFKGIVMA